VNRPTRRGWARWAGASLALAVGVAAVIALAAGPSPYQALGAGDPGLVVRLGAPLARLVADLAATVCLGSLAYAVFFTAPQAGGGVSPAAYAALRTAGRWATGWCVAALLLVPLDAAQTAGLPLTRVLTPGGLTALVGALEGPKAWLGAAAVVAAVAAGCRWTLRWRPVAGLLGLAVLAVLPPLATGHSASDAGHDLATAAIMLHVPAAMLWLGLVVAIGRARGRVVDRAAVLRRYRRTALACWIVLAYSGVVDAVVLVPAGSPPATGYGFLVGVKLAALVLVGVASVAVRGRAARAESGRRPALLARLAGVELAVLAATFGVSAALTGLAPPAFVGHGVTGGETLLGYDLTAAPTLARLALQWRVEPLFAPACAVLAAAYLLGVRRLRRADRPWPPGRTASWLVGCLVLLLATSSGIGRYAPGMFSVQAAAHMLVGMVAPVLFALGAPLTLAGQALRPAPADGLPGPREWLAELRAAPLLRLLTQPLVGTAVFVTAPFALYFTAAFEVTVRYHWAHLATDAVFLVIGYLFAWPVVGVDPPPRPLPNLLRLGMLLAAMPFDIVLGAAILGSGRILGDGRTSANMYSSLALPWVGSLRADQRLGGYLVLGVGELAFLVALGALVAAWNRGEEAGARADGYAELVAALAQRGAATRPDPTRPDPTRPDPTRPDPARPDPARPDPTRPDPTRPDPTRPDPTHPAAAGPRLSAEAAQAQAVGDHQQRGERHGGAGDQRIE
jgi:cytochrome c oxidase assembly factor CtaG/putative copper export protein